MNYRETDDMLLSLMILNEERTVHASALHVIKYMKDESGATLKNLKDFYDMCVKLGFVRKHNGIGVSDDIQFIDSSKEIYQMYINDIDVKTFIRSKKISKLNKNIKK